ncbi:MAG: hypothetical protein GX801_05625 [Fibrobacter sp.]|nr:hypothetical protein [Fibrobacter sp.]
MKFLFLCDENYMKGDVLNFVENFPRNHELVTMSSGQLLTEKVIPEGVQGILAERKTWQKSFSLFRYFGLLPLLETLPFAPVARTKRQVHFKGRSGCKEIFFHADSSAEEIFSTLDRFVSIPPALYKYPLSSVESED